MPNSTNTWESTVLSAAKAGAASNADGDASGDDDAAEAEPPDAADISGHVQVETIFTDGGEELARVTCRVFYDA